MESARTPQRFFVRAFSTLPGANSYSQKELLNDYTSRVGRLADSAPMVEKIQRVYENSDVDTRHYELSIAELDRRHATSASHPLMNDALLSLGRRTIEALFAKNVRIKDCDALIVVGSNFDGFPGMSRRLSEAHGFRDDVFFYDLSALACGGANHGLGLANMLLESGRCKTVCVLMVDALGTFNQLRRIDTMPSISEIVGRVLSSDGAAGLVLSAEPGPGSLFSYSRFDFRVHAWPDSINFGVTETSANGEPFGAIGKGIKMRIVDESAPMLTPEVMADPLFVHPGGIALLRSLVEFAPRLSDTVALSTEILKENGNLTSPTVLFVLKRALERGLAITPRLRLLSFGPGFYTTLSCFQDVKAE
jgi:alkylresorcinol/alkylpyrone synthase